MKHDSVNHFGSPVCPDPVALLIDGENLSLQFADALLREAEAFGVPTVRRVYGKSEHIIGWGDEGYRLVQTKPGKNSADLLLCVEAMSLALRENFQTIIIASSDRDFSYLAEHLRELGHLVVGIGEKKAPVAFRKACSVFVEFILEQTTIEPAPAKSLISDFPPTKVIPLVREVLRHSTLYEGGGTFPFVERHLKRADGGFDSKRFGHEDLEKLLRAVGYFKIEQGLDGAVIVKDPHPKSRVTPAPHSAP